MNDPDPTQSFIQAGMNGLKDFGRTGFTTRFLERKKIKAGKTLKEMWDAIEKWIRKAPDRYKELWEYVDELRMWGRCRITLFEVEWAYVQELKEPEFLEAAFPDLPEEGRYEWDASEPFVASAHITEIPGTEAPALILKIIADRDYQLTVSGNLETFRERSTNFFIVHLEDGFAELRIQEPPTGAIRHAREERERLLNLIGQYLDPTKLKRIELGPVMDALLHERIYQVRAVNLNVDRRQLPPDAPPLRSFLESLFRRAEPTELRACWETKQRVFGLSQLHFWIRNTSDSIGFGAISDPARIDEILEKLVEICRRPDGAGRRGKKGRTKKKGEGWVQPILEELSDHPTAQALVFSSGILAATLILVVLEGLGAYLYDETLNWLLRGVPAVVITVPAEILWFLFFYGPRRIWRGFKILGSLGRKDVLRALWEAWKRRRGEDKEGTYSVSEDSPLADRLGQKEGREEAEGKIPTRLLPAYPEEGSSPSRRAYPRALEKTEREGSRKGTPRVGIALSGGGIRSATLSLGIFQGLARHKLLDRIDYLSTVSGGGYFGSFFCRLFQRPKLRDLAMRSDSSEVKQKDWRKECVRRILLDNTSPPLRLLRENGCYIAPRGAPDLAVGVGVALRNLVSVHVVLAVFAILGFSVLASLRYGVEFWVLGDVHTSRLLGPYLWLSPYLFLALILFTLIPLPAGWAYWQVRDQRRPRRDKGLWKSFWVRWAPPLLILLAAVAFGPHLFPAFALGRGWDWVSLSHGPGLGLEAFGAVALLMGLWYTVGRGFGVREDRSRARAARKNSTVSEPDHNATLRRNLSQYTADGLLLFLVILALGVVDTAGQSLLRLGLLVRGETLSLYALLMAVIPLFRPLVSRLLEGGTASTRFGLPGKLLLTLSVVILLLVLLTPAAMVPHLIVWYGQLEQIRNETFLTGGLEGWVLRLSVLIGASFFLSWAMGQVWPFVNRSTLHAIYEARLSRAYMGASNPARRDEAENRPPVTEPHPDDGAPLQEYFKQPITGGGAPIHLINVTLNQTVGGRSQIERRDRKGMGMAVGPGGISVGRKHHATWKWGTEGANDASEEGVRTPQDETLLAQKSEFRVFHENCSPELLEAGHWIAISGAAFSTGLGSRTSVALSFLAGIFNVRLGYWWDSGLDPWERGETRGWRPVRLLGEGFRWLFPVQAGLLNEWFARFPGVDSKNWYLSDGGHFENMGAYELIRRRLEFIIVCDNEQDEGYSFSGLSTLVRRARTDFGAQIEFLDEEDLKGDIFGGRALGDSGLKEWIRSLPFLRRGRWVKEFGLDPDSSKKYRLTNLEDDLGGYSLGHAALARIRYSEEPKGSGRAPGVTEGLLLYIKPTLTGDEPVDVLQYHTAHPAFPQEPTADQFFDETQWESYRRLGEHIANKLFDEHEDWSPRSMIEG